MVTLSNVTGDQLVGNWGQSLGAGFEARNVRRREQEKQDDLEQKIADALGVGGQKAPETGALGRLGQIAPQMAQAVGQAGQNPEAATALHDEAERGVTLATELQGLPDHASRLKRLAAEAGTTAAAGGDLSRLVALSNLSEGKLDLELQKMQLVGKDTMSLLPQARSPNAAFAALIADNPQVGTALLGRRDKQVAAEQARRAAAGRAAASARAPKTDLGKQIAAINADIKGGHIKPEIGQRQIDNLRAASVAIPEGDAPNVQTIFNPETGLEQNVILEADGTYTELGGTKAPAAVDKFRSATPDEAAAMGVPYGQINEKTGKFIPIQTPPGIEIEATAGGGFRFSQGVGAGDGAETDKPKKDFARTINEDGTFTDTIIKGSPTWDKAIDKSQQARTSLENFNKANDIILDDARIALQLVEDGNFPTTGWAGLASSVPGSPQRALANRLTTIKSGVALNTIVDLKKEGGTLGAVSQSEMELVQAKEGSLDQLGTAEDMAFNLRRIIEMREGAKISMARAYDEDFKQVAVTFGGAPKSFDPSDFASMSKDQLDEISVLDIGVMSPSAIDAYIAAVESAGGDK